mgnify:CR=1 FL=1
MSAKTRTAAVIIVGAGIVGNSAAYYLRKKGLSCIVLEEKMIGDGGSCRNGGGVRQSGRDPREFGLAAYAVKHIWPYLKDELGIDVEYRQTGYLVCGYNEDHYQSIVSRVDTAASFGVEMKMLRGDAIKDICPYVSEHVTCAGWTPSDGVSNPMRATLAYYIRARELGAQFITGEKAVRINKIRGRARQVVTESGNVYEGDKILVAAGYYGRPLLKTVGLYVPLQKKLNEMIVTEPAPHMFDHMIGGMSGFYGQQTVHGSFVFGSPSGREYTFFEQDSTETTAVTTSFIAGSIGIDIPAVKSLKVVRTWGGWVDINLDGVPVLGTVEEVPGLLVVIGSSAHGFGPGPAVGLCMAHLAADEPSPVDISKLHYDRFDYLNKQPRYQSASNGGALIR